MSLLKIASGVLIIVASVLVGNGVVGYYKDRIEFLQELKKFVEFAQSKINFYNTELSHIVSEYSLLCKNKCFLAYLSGKNLLKADEIIFEDYINGIKSLDRNTLQSFSESYLNKIEQEITQLEKVSKVKGETIKKIAPLFGIAIFILLL